MVYFKDFITIKPDKIYNYYIEFFIGDNFKGVESFETDETIN